MKKWLIPALAMLILVVSCTRKQDLSPDTYEYFNTHLRADMSYSAIVTAFGQPDDDLGSGIHIYVFTLKDGTAIWIGFTDKILYARHVTATGTLIHDII